MILLLFFALTSALFLFSTAILFWKLQNRSGRINRLDRDRQALTHQLYEAEKYRSKGILTRKAAHGLNNLLSGLAAYPDVLLLDAKLEPEIEKGLHLIQASGKEATAIVGDLLIISKGPDCKRERINLNTVLEQFTTVNDFKKAEIEFPDTRIKLILEPELSDISASYIHVEKTITYLFGHALRQTEDHPRGQIVFTTSNQFLNTTRAEQENKKPGPYAVLSISDNGPNIDKETQTHFFDPFYSGKPLKKNGSGIELAVVYHAVHDHNGYIDIESGQNNTQIHLFFPAFREQAEKIDSEG